MVTGIFGSEESVHFAHSDHVYPDPAMVQALLCVNDLTKQFGDRRAVDAVSFRVEAGQTLGLLGPNGAGKSTTVGMICGLLRPDRGEILIDGQLVDQGNSAAKRKIGLVPQELALYEDLSARENLRLFGALYGLKGARLKTRCDEVLDLVNLGERAANRVNTFSGGMKRRLNIAAALLHEPQLLILDEPTVGIDPQSRNAILESLAQLHKQGRSLIYASHYMEEVERLADHILIIDHGKVVADETPAALYRRLPAQAALHVELARTAEPGLLAELATLAGVTKVDADGNSVHIALSLPDRALLVLEWLVERGCRPLHFSTAQSNLEDIFLTLTGHRLRD